MSKDDMNKLIEELSEDLHECKPLCHPLLRTAPLILVSIAYVAFICWMLGMRDDFMLKIFSDISYSFELLLALSISISAGLCVGWLNIPDMRGQTWIKAVPMTLLGVFGIWTILRLGQDHENLHLGLHWGHCSLDGLIMIVGPIALLIALGKRGATTQPRWMAFMTILSFSGLTWAGLRLTCGADSFAHAFIQHFIPLIAVGILLGLLAKRIFRW